MASDQFARSIGFSVPKQLDECPNHKARARLSPFCFSLVLYLVAQWLSHSRQLGVPRCHTHGVDLSWSKQSIIAVFCTSWSTRLVFRRRMLHHHYPSDFWRVSKINSVWVQALCTDQNFYSSREDRPPDWTWASRKLRPSTEV